MDDLKQTIKPKTGPKVSASVSFRLFDFSICDREQDYVNEDDDDEGTGNSGSGDISSSGSASSTPSPSPSKTASKRTKGIGKEKIATNRVFQIQMFGMNERGKTCSITVPDFNPFFYAKIGRPGINTEFLPADEWDSNYMRQFVKYLKSLVPDTEEHACELVRHKKLYMFDAGKEHQFIKLVFKNLAAMKRARALWFIAPAAHKTKPLVSASASASASATATATAGAAAAAKPVRSDMRMNPKGLLFQGYALSIYESNLPPLLRYFHIREISPSGWVSFPLSKAKLVKLTDLKRTTCDYEYIVGKNDIVAQNSKEKMVPYKICSFDIEASSSHGDFPIPVKTCKKLATNIVDACISLSSRANMEAINPELLKRLICIAYGKIVPDATSPVESKIDRIYPKARYDDGKIVKCEMKDLARMCAKWLETPLDEFASIAAKGCAAPSVSNAQRIEEMFERMKQRASNEAEADDCDALEGEDEATAADQENCDINDGEHVEELEEEEEDSDHESKYDETSEDESHMSDQSEGRVGTGGPTIIEIIRNPVLDRETKINHVNDTLNAVFPPVEGDIVTFIGSTFVRHGEKAPYCNHCIVLDTCDTSKIERDVPNLVIECYKTEPEVLLAWT